MSSPMFSKTFAQSATCAAGAATQAKTGRGRVHRLLVAAVSAGTVTVYDNTASSGTKLAEWAFAAATNGAFELDLNFAIGCRVVLPAGITATVIFS